MTLLAAPAPKASTSPAPSPMALLSSRSAAASSSLFRPWAASEAASEAAGEATEALVQCSPPVGICAGLSTRASRPAKPRSASTDDAGSGRGAAPATQPILTRLEGLVATLDESSQSSRSSSAGSSKDSVSGSSSAGSCPPSPARDMRTPKSKARADASARKGSAFSAPKTSTASSGMPSSAPSGFPGGMLSPEEVALLAAQQQAFHEEALLAMAGLLPPGVPGMPPGAALPPGGLPAAYLDEYARLLQQEQKAQGAAARKQRPKKYRCPHCQVAFSNNGQLRGHVRIHTGERLIDFQLFRKL